MNCVRELIKGSGKGVAVVTDCVAVVTDCGAGPKMEG